MRVLRLVVAMLTMPLVSLSSGAAQRADLSSGAAQRAEPMQPLQHGRLVVWVVRPAPPPQLTADQIRAKYHEQSAGSFGQTAGTVGQTAGSYGGNPSSLPSTMGEQTVGSVGQTAGSFGHTLSTIATAGDPKPSLPPFEPAVLGADWENWVRQLRNAFGGLNLQTVAVSAVDLGDRLERAAAARALPDVVVGELASSRVQASLGRVAIAQLGKAASEEDALSGEAALARHWAILAVAPHPAEARALIVWLQERIDERGHWPRQGTPQEAEAPATIAVSAVGDVLSGVPLGTLADPEMAQFAALPAQIEALGPIAREVLTGLGLSTEILSARANDRLAIVSLRVIADSPAAFGVLHSLVVLRKGTDRRWRVLQVTGNSAADAVGEGDHALGLYAHGIPPEQVKAVSAIRQASPRDGDTRAAVPDLWWDDAGDAGLLVVEWQAHTAAGWSGTHLVYVPDREPRLQVRVTANFMRPGGEFRWRIWSVAEGGTTALSPWRRLTVVP